MGFIALLLTVLLGLFSGPPKPKPMIVVVANPVSGVAPFTLNGHALSLAPLQILLLRNGDVIRFRRDAAPIRVTDECRRSTTTLLGLTWHVHLHGGVYTVQTPTFGFEAQVKPSVC